MFFLLSLCADVFRCSVFSELLYALSLQNYHMLCLFKIIICSAYPILSYALSIQNYYMLCLSDTIVCSVYSIRLYALSIRYYHMFCLFKIIICPVYSILLYVFMKARQLIYLSIYLCVCLSTFLLHYYTANLFPFYTLL